MTLLGWFVLSNHCALGSFTKRTETKKEHDCCHNGSSQPAKEPADGGQGMQCCKSVHATVLDAAKMADVLVSMIVGVVIAWTETLQWENAALVSAVDTGPPPRASSFSELVLQRSLRSHAPPFLA